VTIQNIGIFSVDPETQHPSPGWFVTAVMEMLKPVYYLVGDNVLAVGDTAESVIFVIDGFAEELQMRSGPVNMMECVNLYPPGSMIYHQVFSNQPCETFVRCVKALRTYHLDKQACGGIEESDPLLAKMLRTQITTCAVEQVTNFAIRDDIAKRTEKLNGSVQERLDLISSTPRWAKQAGQDDALQRGQTLSRKGNGMLEPKDPLTGQHSWIPRADRDRNNRLSDPDNPQLPGQADNPQDPERANPQDPSQESSTTRGRGSASAAGAPGFQPAAPIDEEIAS